MTMSIEMPRDREAMHRLAAAIVLALSTLAVTTQAAAQANYPVRPIRA